MLKTSVYITIWPNRRFFRILLSVLVLGLWLVPLSPSAAEKTKKSHRLEDGSRYRYPLMDGFIVGADFFQPLLTAFGQGYANYQVSLEVSLHNWFFPIWEVGLGRANSTPNDRNFTYKVSPTIYNRVGILYNPSYNSTAIGYFYMGILYGFSTFSYDLTNIDLSSSFWGTTATAAIRDCSSHAQWLEPLGGIRVKLYKGLKMGFSVRYKILLHARNYKTTQPWIIPGMGKRSGGFDFTYSLYYQVGFGVRKRSSHPNFE